MAAAKLKIIANMGKKERLFLYGDII